MTHVNPFVVQEAYRARNDDGNEATATWKADNNVAWTQAVDEVFRLRICPAETAGGAANNYNYRFEYQLNGNGTWVAITTSTAVCRFAVSPNVADAEPTTNQILSGLGSFVAGSIVETGATGNISLTNQWSEIEAVLTLVSADLNNGDTITLRLTNGGVALDSYNNIASLTVSKAAPPESDVILSGTDGADLMSADVNLQNISELELAGVDGADSATADVSIHTNSEVTLVGTDGADSMSSALELSHTPKELTLAATDGPDEMSIRIRRPGTPRLIPPVTGIGIITAT